jgi:glycerol-3-phosphate acyltransferase PlsX
MTTICVDAMGGDETPELVCEGIASALATDPDLSVLVAGDEDVVAPFCESHDRALPLVTTQSIGMVEHPAEAVRSKPDSSIVRACRAVREGQADAFFSAGSTGAILAASTLGVGRLKGVKRPALCVAFPAVNDHSTAVLDLGANADVRPEMIVQFAQMGAAFAQVVLGYQSPRVALLSNGSEDTKGSEQALAFHAALSEADCGFVGNCEGGDLLRGTFDVIVTDGFTGNVALKTLEGTAKFIAAQLSQAAHSNLRYGFGGTLIKPAMGQVATKLSGDAYGGATLLGLKAPVMVGHGRTSVEAVSNATLAMAREVRGGLVDKLASACHLGA